MNSLIRLADRKGLLKGKLNLLQEEALQWLMIRENEERISIERERMKYTILAGNPQLWKVLYEDEEDERFGEIEWTTPQSYEEVEELERIINETHRMNYRPADIQSS